MNHESDQVQQLCEATEGFRRRFEVLSRGLSLAEYLTDHELGVFCLAAYYATLCNIAFNGLGGCRGRIRPERERHRIGLERAFMHVRERVYQCTGWRRLPIATREAITRSLFTVCVADNNLA